MPPENDGTGRGADKGLRIHHGAKARRPKSIEPSRAAASPTPGQPCSDIRHATSPTPGNSSAPKANVCTARGPPGGVIRRARTRAPSHVTGQHIAR